VHREGRACGVFPTFRGPALRLPHRRSLVRGGTTDPASEYTKTHQTRSISVLAQNQYGIPATLLGCAHEAEQPVFCVGDDISGNDCGVACAGDSRPARRHLCRLEGEYSNADGKLAKFKEIGFRIVSFVPLYGYTGLNKIDRTTGPDAAELARAIETATRMGLAVVLKPHLDPLIYSPGFDAFQSENDSWRVSCPGVASSTWTR